MLAAVAALLYLYFESKGKGSGKASDALATSNVLAVDRFIEADLQLTSATSILKSSTMYNPFEFYHIDKSIKKFIKTYIDCFTSSDTATVNALFSDLTMTRREILNRIVELDIEEHIVHDFQQVLWKYINALILKYDLNYQYPIARNEYDALDVY